MVDSIKPLSFVAPVVCSKCGRVKNMSNQQHYVNGKLQCACGKDIDMCCQGETANELLD
jgi:hypothetical protein